MRRGLIIGLAIGICLWFVLPGAVRAWQAAQSGITSPADNAVVRGTVPIVGTAVDGNFWKYELYYAREPAAGDEWVFIGSIHESPVVNGLLETWVTSSLPDGTYALRLRVVDRTAQYREFYVRNISVANTAPTETPPPTETPEGAADAPTATPTSAEPQATPTFIIPEDPLAQPTVTPTLARPTSSLPTIVDVGSWRQSFCLGTQLMAAVVIGIGLVFALRRLF